MENLYKKLNALMEKKKVEFIRRLKEINKGNKLFNTLQHIYNKILNDTLTLLKELPNKNEVLKQLLLDKDKTDRFKLLKKYFETWKNTIVSNRCLKGLRNNNITSMATKAETSIKESLQEHLTGNDFDQKVNNLIKTLSKMKLRCTRQSKENTLKQVKGKLCSIECTAKVPKYLQQKRLKPTISVNPSYRSKTFAHIANII